MPEINYISRVYSVAAILWLQLMVQIMLFFNEKLFFYIYISTFRSMFAAPNTAVSVLCCCAFPVCC